MSPIQLKRMHNAQLVRLKGILPKKVRMPEEPERDPNPFKLPTETVVVQQEDGQTIAQKLSKFEITQSHNTIIIQKLLTVSLQLRRPSPIWKQGDAGLLARNSG